MLMKRWIQVVVPFFFAASFFPGIAAGQEPVDILIVHGSVITMDTDRRIIDDGAVAILGDRIQAVGSTKELQEHYIAAKTIDARRKVVMPGLIDGHAHAGHGLLKSLGMDLPGEWYRACRGALRRRIDGGILACRCPPLVARTAQVWSDLRRHVFRWWRQRHANGRSPIWRSTPRRRSSKWAFGSFSPWVLGDRRTRRKYSHWKGGAHRDVMVSFEQQLETSETLIKRWHGKADGKIHIAMMFPTHHPENAVLSATELQDLKRRTLAARALSKKYGLLFTQDGHTRGTVKFAHEELGILGPDALLSHSTELSEEEIQICRETETRIVHNPSANTLDEGPLPRSRAHRRGRDRHVGLGWCRAGPKLRYVPAHVPGHALPSFLLS